MDQREWDDDSAYRSAVRRTRITMALALVATLLLLGGVAVAVFGMSLFLDLLDSLSR
ncbi:hypothetical protein ACF064_21585 [Streptomyces sp. NPDC015492]|uniref:hypothetical protein n=1 Tax=Streptomyces sp. NPDC015492 TaxID=3364958 RepID=UPI0036FC2102